MAGVPRPSIGKSWQAYYAARIRRHLAENLTAVPDVGRDEDFARVDDGGETPRVPR
jgi:hypothetical protein